ncbi:unnamed protein product, partial [Pylaiella littoralis]
VTTNHHQITLRHQPPLLGLLPCRDPGRCVCVLSLCSCVQGALSCRRGNSLRAWAIHHAPSHGMVV